MSPDPESVPLPEPPPPRPAARDAAIEAALKRFDGVEEKPAVPVRPTPWTRKPQFQLAIAASLLLVIGLPATLIGLRNQPSHPLAVAPAAAPAASEEGRATADVAENVASPETSPAVTRPAPPPALAVPTPPPVVVSTIQSLPPAMAAPPPVAASEREEGYAAAPPPPPPPPPPPAPAPMVAQKSAEGATSDVVVTGTRIARPNLTSPSPVTVVGSERDAVGTAKKDRSYAAFLNRLQSAVRDNDPGAVVRLISFPLRVNSGEHSQTYADAKSVRRDFDSIFTPRVRQAILAQRADRLFSRDLGVMVGNGEVWFDHVCADESCSRLGPVRITAINR